MSSPRCKFPSINMAAFSGIVGDKFSHGEYLYAELLGEWERSGKTSPNLMTILIPLSSGHLISTLSSYEHTYATVCGELKRKMLAEGTIIVIDVKDLEVRQLPVPQAALDSGEAVRKVSPHARRGHWGQRWVGSGKDKRLERRWIKGSTINSKDLVQ